MAIETELKLSIPPTSARTLSAHPLLQACPPRATRLINRYYDTDDLALRRRGIALRFRQKGDHWLLTVKSAEPAAGGLARRQEWEYPATPGVFDFSPLDDARLRRWLERRRRQLRCIFTTDFIRHAWIVPPTAIGGAVIAPRIELALDRGSLWAGEHASESAAGAHGRICEVELELLDGNDPAPLFALALQLQETLPLHPARASKAERGYLLATASAQAAAPYRHIPKLPQSSAGPRADFAAIALQAIDHLQRNEAGVIAGIDPEYLHQARVAIRRLRSALKLWKKALPPDFESRFALAWKQLAEALGNSRDWDVLATELLPPLAAAFPAHPGLASCQTLIEQARRQEQQQARRAMQSPAYSRLLLEFTAALLALAETGSPRSDFLPRSLATRQRRVKRLLAGAIGGTARSQHALRIALKNLRYSIEFLAPRLSPRQAERALGSLKPLLDQLGHLNDLTVSLSRLDQLRMPERGQAGGRRRTPPSATSKTTALSPSHPGGQDLLRGWITAQIHLGQPLLQSTLRQWKLPVLSGMPESLPQRVD